MSTFEVVRGAKTNRVRASRARERDASPQRALSRYAADPTLRGKLIATVCITMPVEVLAELDRIAAERRMARSHLLRELVEREAAL